MVTTSTFAASSTSFYVVAHEDDWQLFMGLNAALDVPAPDSKTVFVHTTAGDAGLGTGTGAMRLRGDRAAHEMAESYAHGAGLPIAARGTLQ
jgi:hypothetical protein